MKFSFILQIGRKEIITTGTLTRAYYLRINKQVFLTIEILGYFQFHWFITKAILYNHMTFFGNYDRHFRLH